MCMWTCTAIAQQNSDKDYRIRGYLDLSKSVKTEVVYKGKHMYQFLVSVYKVSKENPKDTTFKNQIMWVEAESGEDILKFQRSLWIEAAWVKYKKGYFGRSGKWIEVTKPSDSSTMENNPKSICKIYNFGLQFPLPNTNNGGQDNSNTNSTNNGNKPLLQIPTVSDKKSGNKTTSDGIQIPH